MEENRTRSAMEDLRVIRGVLDQSTSSLRGLAPLFWRMGLVWLVCALVLLWIEGGDLLCYLFPVLNWSGGTALYLGLDLGQWIRVFLWGFLAVQWMLWQRKRTSGELSERGRRLLGLWQTLLVLYLCLYALAAVGDWMAQQGSLVSGAGMEPQGAIGVSADGASVWQACAMLKLIPPILFPALPPLLTGTFLEDRPLQVFGLGVLTLYLAVIVGSLFGVILGAQGVGALSDLLIVGSLLLSLVQYILPPAALMATARRIKTLEKGG